MIQDLRANGDRLWQSIMRMAEIGPGEHGGSRRLTLSDEDKQARDLFADWCQKEGCQISIDELGNMFAHRSGLGLDLAPVVIGSHLDTQSHGGKFDGVYGVLAALEVVRTLNENNIQTKHPIEIVNWTNEEGARFAPAMLASGVFAGLFDLNFALSRKDENGLSFGDELKRIGYKGDQPCGGREFKALFEAHIEQGPILEKNNNSIGVVTAAQGQRWFDVTLKGRDSHAGSTPMPGRRDALNGAAQMIVKARKIAEQYPPDAVITIGSLNVVPNSRNTIAGEVFFTIDIRHPDDSILKLMADALKVQCKNIAQVNNLELAFEQIWHNPPVEFNQQCVSAVRDSTQMLGINYQDIVSGAGHDAVQIARVAPTSMIFVPCKDGISHNENESAKLKDLEDGCNVLLHAALKMAN